jgi:uncharacterized membrane protein
MSRDSDARLDRLEAQVDDLETTLNELKLAASGYSNAPRYLDQPPPPVASQRLGDPSSPVDAATASPPTSHRPVDVNSEALLKWSGVLLVVLAVGFAVSTAIRRGWIGPELQLAGAVGVSLTLIGVGLRLRPSRPLWTHALCSGGIAALFTIAASNLFVDQTSSDIALAFAVAIGLGGFGLARLIPSEWVAVTTILGGSVAWIVIADDEFPLFATEMWFVGLVGVTLALTVEQRWFAARLLAHGVGLIAIAGMADEVATTAETAVLFGATSLLVASLFWLPSVGDLTTFWQHLEVQLVSVVPPWIFGVVAIALDLDSDTTVGFVALGVAAGSAAAAVGLRPRITMAHFISIVIGASVALTIGLAVLLSTPAEFVAVGVQGAGLVILSRVLSDNIRLLINAAVISAVAAVYAAENMLGAWVDDVPIGDDIGHLAIVAALGVAGWQTGRRGVQRLTALSVLVLIMIWLGSVLGHLPEGQAAVSVSWAVIGVTALVVGAVKKLPEVSATGLTVLGVTVAKLLTVDLREVDTLWRAGLFFVVGLGIMRLGFLLPHLTKVGDQAQSLVGDPV